MVPIGGPTAIEGVWAIWIPERFLSASRGRSPIVGIGKTGTRLSREKF